MLRLLALLTAALMATAGEYAVLETGFRLYAERHERHGDTIRLHRDGGFIELPARAVVSFERVEPTQTVAASAPPMGRQLSPHQLITEAALRHGLPPGFVHSVVRVESAYRPDAISRKGARGLMQLMPATARRLGADPDDPKQNVEAGVRYLRELLLQYRDDPWQVRKALAAYNAGPGAVQRYRGVPPYQETLRYIERVLRLYAPSPPDPAPERR
ncbi:MAG: lytic transglycosylase domain-containing protein [Bryobacterales bacterium]|nr:lytic transglycosylase domain-containing protein [Bryobacteraceae bacterium]MDW8355755.1 lytic transglycosylase domain-containing protein [Bryobacterales bacterium]